MFVVHFIHKSYFNVSLYSLTRSFYYYEQNSANAGACIVHIEWSLYISGAIYSCFEKGCPTKPYATMPKGIMGNGGLWYLIEALGVSAT